MKNNLSKNFTLKELTKTSTGIPNNPDKNAIDNLSALVEKVLQPARDRLGSAITVTSGYRSLAVNQAVGGSSTSDHMLGRAADLQCKNNKRLFEILMWMDKDQLIWEFGDDNQPQWVHVSYREGDNRNQVLRAVRKNGKVRYLPMK